MGKEKSFQQIALEQLNKEMGKKRKNFGSCLTTYTKVNLSWTIDLKVTFKSTQLLEETIVEHNIEGHI